MREIHITNVPFFLNERGIADGDTLLAAVRYEAELKVPGETQILLAFLVLVRKAAGRTVLYDLIADNPKRLVENYPMSDEEAIAGLLEGVERKRTRIEAAGGVFNTRVVDVRSNDRNRIVSALALLGMKKTRADEVGEAS